MTSKIVVTRIGVKAVNPGLTDAQIARDAVSGDDLTQPLDHVAEGYQAMDERRAIKTLLRPNRAR